MEILEMGHRRTRLSGSRPSLTEIDRLYSLHRFALAPDRVRAPTVVAVREIASEVRPARFFAPERGARDQLRDGQKIARRPAKLRLRDTLEFIERAQQR